MACAIVRVQAADDPSLIEYSRACLQRLSQTHGVLRHPRLRIPSHSNQVRLMVRLMKPPEPIRRLPWTHVYRKCSLPSCRTEHSISKNLDKAADAGILVFGRRRTHDEVANRHYREAAVNIRSSQADRDSNTARATMSKMHKAGPTIPCQPLSRKSFSIRCPKRKVDAKRLDVITR